MNWNQHISNITTKAHRLLDLIKRICRDLNDVDTRTLYFSLVSSQPEYSSQLWSPSQINHKLLLENVQRGPTKFILNYLKDKNYTERLVELNLIAPRGL